MSLFLPFPLFYLPNSILTPYPPPPPSLYFWHHFLSQSKKNVWSMGNTGNDKISFLYFFIMELPQSDIFYSTLYMSSKYKLRKTMVHRCSQVSYDRWLYLVGPRTCFFLFYEPTCLSVGWLVGWSVGRCVIISYLIKQGCKHSRGSSLNF